MRAQHQVLFGEDLISGLTIGASFYRAQVEHELRAKLIRLRQKAGGILSDRELLLQLMAGSISTFCVLFRHALRIAGDRPVFDKREIVKAARERFGIDAAPFDTILDLREEDEAEVCREPGGGSAFVSARDRNCGESSRSNGELSV